MDVIIFVCVSFFMCFADIFVQPQFLSAGVGDQDPLVTFPGLANGLTAPRDRFGV